ncbi:uncharacterized protein LOC116349224 isoform X1 [Contarinia nasturtii]|uniref:uncharacterized protein LOC116349224 isoform X1 n=1 Tax=Contarinia nasturtii TaxID=265458 RepID=UPI0012D3B09A|nr:uncharacterized protein LOC116349224 isoform X1 [Contarinia nasturtii]
MWKIFILCSLFALSLAHVIHDVEPLESETDHHHKIDHEHAISHQSFKIHHFHAVPVYVKHEDQHYLKNPIEVGGVKHKHKVLHPETKPSHSYGLELENETDHKDYTLHEYSADGSQYDGSQQHHQYETIENQADFDGGSFGSAGEAKELSHHQFQDITVHHGHGQ